MPPTRSQNKPAPLLTDLAATPACPTSISSQQHGVAALLLVLLSGGRIGPKSSHGRVNICSTAPLSHPPRPAHTDADDGQGDAAAAAGRGMRGGGHVGPVVLGAGADPSQAFRQRGLVLWGLERGVVRGEGHGHGRRGRVHTNHRSRRCREGPKDSRVWSRWGVVACRVGAVVAVCDTPGRQRAVGVVGECWTHTLVRGRAGGCCIQTCRGLRYLMHTQCNDLHQRCRQGGRTDVRHCVLPAARPSWRTWNGACRTPQPHGDGRYTWQDGSWYEGGWQVSTCLWGAVCLLPGCQGGQLHVGRQACARRVPADLPSSRPRPLRCRCLLCKSVSTTGLRH